MVLIMSVNPGFANQRFIPSALKKLGEARRRIDESGLDIRLEIDGGIKVENIRKVCLAGADTFVAGSAIFGAVNEDDPNCYDSVIREIRSELSEVES